MLRKILKTVLYLFIIIISFLLIEYLWSGSPETTPGSPDQRILAHRGVHLNYQKGVYDRKTGCEAQHIFTPSHGYIENTLASIGAAFDFGADIVEMDIRMTADSDLVIFHDYMLECRTDGHGLIREHSVAELKTLDVGYGYSADGGETFPFRGKGKGLMVTLQEVLDSFPDRSFLIDHKDRNRESADVLIRILSRYTAEQRSRCYLWTSPAMNEYIRGYYPEMHSYFLLYGEAKGYFLPWFFTFGFRDIPEQYRGRVMAMPAEYVKYIWGWPHRFLNAVHRQGLEFHIMLETQEEAEHFRNIPVDGFVTDHIEITGPILKQ